LAIGSRQDVFSETAQRCAESVRECRGLVLHRDGAVLVRPLHRFSSLGQTPETQLAELGYRGVEVVTRKLDGQMVCGVVIDDMVQLWTRAGPTAVGQEAFRVTVAAEADCVGFVRYAALHESTAVFEYIGRRSHKKAFEGNLYRVVLLAVRFHASGEYWVDEQMRAAAAAFGVPVVQRLYHLEGMRICELQREVDVWHNCEGVVIRMSDSDRNSGGTFLQQSHCDAGNWLKIKSKWWKRSGYSSNFSAKVAAKVEEVQQVVVRSRQRGEHHSMRVALTGLPQDTRPVEIASLFLECCRVEMVFSLNGKLRLAVVTFKSMAASRLQGMMC
jgi:hypothetical protein